VAIAGLNATLLSYVLGRQDEDVPVWRMLRQDRASLKRRARQWASAAGEAGDIVESRTMVGGGSLPGQGVATWCARIRSPHGATELARRLRAGSTPVVGRIDDDAVLLDPRTVAPANDREVKEAITSALRGIRK
jgi:L-seryl-tRNA(Ser) seleniumtransferase